MGSNLPQWMQKKAQEGAIHVEERKSDAEVITGLVISYVQQLKLSDENKAVLESILNRIFNNVVKMRTQGTERVTTIQRSFLSFATSKDKESIQTFLNIEDKNQWTSFVDSMETMIDNIPSVARSGGLKNGVQSVKTVGINPKFK